jgi:phospholipase/carboxylesterase
VSAGTLEHRIRPADGDPAGALVLLHGRGADEHDLLPLLDALDPERRLVGVCPRGPLSLPPGGAHWYVVRAIGFPDPETFLGTYERASRWLDSVPELTGVPLARTIVGGFSQGCVMSYALGLGQGRPSPAGIVGFSGFLPTVPGWELDLDRPGLRLAIGHGTHDPVIEIAWGRDARDRLTAAGFAVSYRESPIGHSLDPAFVRLLASWVRETIDAARA